jgi:hypothetical protein
MTRATQAKGLPVNREPFAEFFHSFSVRRANGAIHAVRGLYRDLLHRMGRAVPDKKSKTRFRSMKTIR